MRVLFVGPLSGALAAGGVAEYDGMKAAASVLNAKGGASGHKVVVTGLDDGGSGVTAVSKVEQAIAGGTTYTAADAGVFGQDAVPLEAVLAKTHIIDFGPLADSFVDPPKAPNVFIPGTLATTPEIAMVAAMKAKGVTKFAIVTGNDTSTQLGAKDLAAAAKSAGVTVTAVELVPDTAVDATPQMSAALATHPQAIAVTNYSPALGPVLKARATLDPTIPLYGDQYVGAANIAALTPNIKGIYIVTFPFLEFGNPAQNTPEWKAFIAADHITDPKPAISVYADITGYDIVMAAAGAVDKAGTVAGPAVVTAQGQISSSSQAPGFVGNFPLFTPTSHGWQLTPSDYQTLPAAPWKDGLLNPSS
jgi:branched-chain amino acid transport system substrate-binding protein